MTMMDPADEWDAEAAANLVKISAEAIAEGWKEAAVAWEVCASMHRSFAKKKDPFFTTRQAAFIKHAEAARAVVNQLTIKEKTNP